MTDIPSIHDHATVHVRPELSPELGKDLARIVPSARSGGVYVQTRGPRIETMAEVAALAKIADVVGMTLASEATLACELGMKFAALCTVDNYANGLGSEVLSYEHILSTALEHRTWTEEIITNIIRKMGRDRVAQHTMTDIFEKNYTLLITNVAVNGKPVDIFIDATGSIGGIGEHERKKHKGEAEFIIDGDGAIALPGLVNTHTHAAMTLLRGYADDMILGRRSIG